MDTNKNVKYSEVKAQEYKVLVREGKARACIFCKHANPVFLWDDEDNMQIDCFHLEQRVSERCNCVDGFKKLSE